MFTDCKGCTVEQLAQSKPVCGTNACSYEDKCVLEYSICVGMSHKNLTIAHDGYCEGMQGPLNCLYFNKGWLYKLKYYAPCMTF